MKTHVFEITKDEEILILNFLTACAEIPKPRPMKFHLADEAFAQLSLNKPLGAETLMGLLDSIGGYFSAISSATGILEVELSTLERTVAFDLMKLATKLENQAKRIGLFPLTVVKS